MKKTTTTSAERIYTERISLGLVDRKSVIIGNMNPLGTADIQIFETRTT